MTLLFGFIFGMSLIMSLGIQNLFLIRQGFKHEYAFQCALISSLCDTVLIVLGVAGTAQLIAHLPSLQMGMSIVAIAFLLYHGINAFYRGYTLKQVRTNTDNQTTTPSQYNILITCLCFSLINPQAILECVMIIGSIVGHQPPNQQLAFTLGIIGSSFFWFFGITMLAMHTSKYLKIRAGLAND